MNGRKKFVWVSILTQCRGKAFSVTNVVIHSDNKAMEGHIKKEHSTKFIDKINPTVQTTEKVYGVVGKNVKCDKWNSGFTSKMALSQHMFRHTYPQG